MKLSEKRRTEIYAAVSNRIMDLRIALAKLPGLQSTKLGEQVDDLAYRAQCEASDAALKAAEGK